MEGRRRGTHFNPVLVPASAAHILKLEWYREGWHGPCTRMTCKFVKRSMFFKYHISHIWNLKYDTDELSYETETDSDIENRFVVANGEGR